MGLFGKEDRPAPKPQVHARQPEPAPAPARQASRDATIIARSSVANGTLTGSGDVEIHGTFQGKVQISGRVTVAETGKVTAALHGKVVIVAGQVEGDVTADERIELKETATLTGDITAPRILIREGGTFEGQVHMKAPNKVKPANGGKRSGAQPKHD